VLTVCQPSEKALLNAISDLIQSRCGGKPPPLVKSVKATRKPTQKQTGTKDDTPINNKNALRAEKKKTIRHSNRVQAEDRIRGSRPPTQANRYSVYSPAKEAGLLNADLGGMMGGLQGMGPLGAMMGSMGLGGDDDDEDAAEEERKKKEEEEKLKKKDPMQQLGRRQRKRVVRIGR
jgi:signal recognition particle subunit SRP19